MFLVRRAWRAPFIYIAYIAQRGCTITFSMQPAHFLWEMWNTRLWENSSQYGSYRFIMRDQPERWVEKHKRCHKIQLKIWNAWFFCTIFKTSFGKIDSFANICEISCNLLRFASFHILLLHFFKAVLSLSLFNVIIINRILITNLNDLVLEWLSPRHKSCEKYKIDQSTRA